jgi:quaternary ammonium compound-resistance protein SugE
VPWLYLVVAGLLEVAWSYAMKQSNGFTRFWPTAIMVVAMLGSVGFLALAMRTLPLGTSYVIWTGIGAVGAFVIGIAFLDEAATSARLIAAALIVSGLVLMRIGSHD